MNLWHDISPGTKESMNMIVEINKGSHNKYELDKETGIIHLDRVLHTAQEFPVDYGFVPQTLWDDGDPLDVVLLATYPLIPGVLVAVRPVGILNMIDSGEGDHKIVAVPIKDPRFDNIQDVGDVNPQTLKEIEHFYQTYKKLQNKVVETNGFEGKIAAEVAFVKAIDLYKIKFSK